MKKRFDFKLQPVLRLKELREQQVKNELGILQKKIIEQEGLIKRFKKNIEFYFERYEQAETSRGNLLNGLRTHMPEFLTSQYNKIANCKNEIENLVQLRIELLSKLSKAKGETKLFTNLREKKRLEHKSKLNKKINAEIEEWSIIKGGKYVPK